MEQTSIIELLARKQQFIDRLEELRSEFEGSHMPPQERCVEIRREIAECFFGVELVNRTIALRLQMS